MPRQPAPYEVPDKEGRCWLLAMPEEVLANVFTRLDRCSLTRCYRLCKPLHSVLSDNSKIALHHLLQTSSLRLNPHALLPPSDPHRHAPSSAELLSSLRDKLDRWASFSPRSEASYELKEPEGRLYEYLEGILLRGVGDRTSLPREVAVYDLSKVEEWENIGSDEEQEGEQHVEETSPEVIQEEEDAVDLRENHEADVRTSKKFSFQVAEFAVDKGLDLLVLVEVRLPTPEHPRQHTMVIHLLSLSTFEPHPRASRPVLEWPVPLYRRKISLGFQICDDGLFILHHNQPGPSHDMVCGWQWTTGRLAVTLRAFPTMSFESFVLLTPWSFVVPSVLAHLDPQSFLHERLDDPSDLTWTHHLHLYAFPPFSSTEPADGSDPHPPPHTATHVATIDLLPFHVDPMHDMPPPRLNIRTDPPPRHSFPTHPKDSPMQFHPDPESGLCVMEILCQMPGGRDPHYVMCFPKSALTQYLPAPTSPLLRQAFPRPAPVVPWSTLAPNVRLFGPDLEQASWVCYVYQNRYVTPLQLPDGRSVIRLYDFDPLRVRREKLSRIHASGESVPDPSSSPPAKRTSLFRKQQPEANPIDGERNGVHLVTDETVLAKDQPLTEETRTGRDLSYTYVEIESEAEVTLIDGDRIVAVEPQDGPLSFVHPKAELTIMTF
ncbi:hypothetical protein JCM24511_07084 [Saitozyma sp. JCM 24511]|nr:hypothetical protein JCM24511_07084 [Saitozyma sp. JCM 24511]